ncbi:MAPEG family protein [Aliiroseovarius subalbicans]|uniref:MAPEG family protein n=1 Tax=Aliiroseovarius subalbicans TaxID=2925840 RepID=UPI001F573063|nr:MAPEG family protein [Aliiroseovarius subalbicans]MCI2399774.1 MAPEG family protein [Aliiroseovarius subalbicans]
MTTLILAVLALFVVQTFLPSTARALSGDRVQKQFLRGNRDTRPEPGVLGGRMERALVNMIEALIVFLPLAVLAEAKGIDATTGATVFLLARVAYVPAYAAGIPLLRSAIWTVGHVGLGMMVWALWPA